MTTAPLAPKPDHSKKADIVHMLFAMSIIILVSTVYSTTKAAEVIRVYAVCFASLMFTIEFLLALYERRLLKKQGRDINDKPDAV